METQTNYDLVIYHGGCPDGLGGAWCFWKNMGQETNKFYGGWYGGPAPDVKNKRVLFIDFTFCEKVMRKIVESAAYVKVLDHHKSAEYLRLFEYDNFLLVLDMKRSGCQIAWDELYATDERPWFINDIADRDIWTWSINDSKKTTRAMNALGFYKSLKSFNCITENERSYYVDVGNILNQVDEIKFNECCSKAVNCWAKSLIEPQKIWKVKLIEYDRKYASEVGVKLLEKASDESFDFAAIYSYDIKYNIWKISLRALQDNNIDLTEVVKHFGNGGGHAKAAGFKIYGDNQHTLKTIFKPITKEKR